MSIAPNVEQLQDLLQEQHYVADRSIAMAVYLAQHLQKPLLVEGPAGVGKTEIAKVMARILDTELIRLQCYEGLDAYTALYEWNYQRQLLTIKMDEQSDRNLEAKEELIFSEDFLLKRPLLRAITHPSTPVLLIDELDRADEEFESFLLELLSDWQISIPELGAIQAEHIPFVVITSNRTRDLSDAVRRRCLYLWIDYPPFAKELAIVKSKVPDIDERLAREICRFMQLLRQEHLDKTPGVAESYDWARALVRLHQDHLDPETVAATLGVICKSHSDLQHLDEDHLRKLLGKIGGED